MSISGPEALRSLEEALRDVRREEDDIAKRLSRSGELIAKMRQQESDLLRQLAAVRLDPATQTQLSGPLNSAEQKAREMLKSHGAALGEVEDKLKSLDSDIAKLAAERTGLLAEIGKHEAALSTLAEKIKPALGKRADYAQALDNAKALVAVADESLRKTQQAEEDREQKGKPYRDDPLFMYLWERGYSTKNYRANNLVVWLDGVVAGMVGYADARPNFAMLNEIPLRLREHAERQQESARAALDAVGALEAAAIDEAGGKATRAAREAAQSRLAAIDAEMVTLQDQRDEATKTQRDLAQGSDPAYASAIAALAEALGREDARTLLEAARQTATGQDDTIVQQIDEARQRASEEDADTREQKARLKTLAGRRRELEDIQYEFKKSGFDQPSSSFREDNLVGDVLNEFLRGGISAASYWDQWQRSQNWSGGDRRGDTAGSGNWGSFNWPDSSFGGGSRRSGPSIGGGWAPSPGRPSTGGGFSRPRVGSSGTRTGGGFKTGGGF
jgi:chromosome segregation ATPase